MSPPAYQCPRTTVLSRAQATWPVSWPFLTWRGEEWRRDRVTDGATTHTSASQQFHPKGSSSLCPCQAFPPLHPSSAPRPWNFWSSRLFDLFYSTLSSILGNPSLPSNNLEAFDCLDDCFQQGPEAAKSSTSRPSGVQVDTSKTYTRQLIRRWWYPQRVTGLCCLEFFVFSLSFSSGAPLRLQHLAGLHWPVSVSSRTVSMCSARPPRTGHPVMVSTRRQVSCRHMSASPARKDTAFRSSISSSFGQASWVRCRARILRCAK